MSLRTTANVMIFASALTWSGCASMTTAKTPADPDEFFMMQAAEANLAEIAAGHLAVARGTSNAVKQFGQQMIDDHTRANEELMQIARKKGVTLPTRPDEESAAMAAHLEKLTGAEFDREFISHMQGGHAQVVSMFEDKASSAKDPELRAWAGRMVPILQQHLQLAGTINQSLGGTSNVGM